MIICSVNLRDGDKVTYLWTVKTLNDKVKLLNNGAKIYWLTINWQNIIVSKINDLMIAKIAKNFLVKHFCEIVPISEHFLKLKWLSNPLDIQLTPQHLRRRRPVSILYPLHTPINTKGLPVFLGGIKWELVQNTL